MRILARTWTMPAIPAIPLRMGDLHLNHKNIKATTKALSESQDSREETMTNYFDTTNLENGCQS